MGVNFADSYYTGYEFTEASGVRYSTVLRDWVVGDSNNCLLISVPTRETGPGGVGYSIGFAGDDAIDWLSPSADTEFPTNADWTFTFWFARNTTDNPAAEQHLFSWQCGGTSEAIHTYLNTSEQFIFEVWKVSPDEVLKSLTWGSTFNDTSWHFVVLQHDVSELKISLTIDNGTTVVSSAYVGAINTATGPWALGTRKLNDLFFNGKMASFHSWKRILNASEMTTLYNAGASALTYPFGNWKAVLVGA